MRLFCTIFVALSVMHGARAWDAVGHMIVCQIAYDNLTPAAKQHVDAALARFNAAEKSEYTPVIAGTWMDDIRGKTREYNPWHYINLPYNLTGDPFPAEDEVNVLWGINTCLAILDDKTTYPGVDRDQALVMLTHLVGDVHQPLHATSREGDLGGNRVMVPNLVDPELAIFNAQGNLHWFWDTSYRKTVDENGDIVSLYAAPLYSRNAPVVGHKKALALVQEKAAEFRAKYSPSEDDIQGSPEEWTRENHRLGFEFAYAKLPGGDGANPVTLTADYVDEAREISEKRLVLAGYRLAHILNQRFQ